MTRNLRAILGHMLFNLALTVGGDGFFKDIDDAFRDAETKGEKP